jgi:hypothetical protein
MENAAALPLALCDDGKALGKGPVLKALESFIRGLEWLFMGRSWEMSWREDFGGYPNLQSQQRGYCGGSRALNRIHYGK